MFSFQPLEIIHLIPLILCFRSNCLYRTSAFVNPRNTPKTYMKLWDRGEPNIRTILNDRPTCAKEVYIHVLAVVYTDLSWSHNNHAILNCSNVSGTRYMTRNNQGFINVFQHEAGEGCTIGGGNGHINNASIHLGNRTRGCSSRRRRR